ncbi:MAG TPA: rod shape-determining protein MreD [Solirubrobacterales bacterium]
MILTGKILARVVVALVLGVVLQLSFFSQVTLFHVSPDMLPALVACFGLLGGTMSGAVTGFSVGLLLDCLLIAPLGGGSLVLLATGYLAGAYRERFGLPKRLGAPLLCAALTLFAELGFGAVQAMLGEVGSNVSPLVLRDIAFKAIFAFFLSWPMYAGLRRLLRPALVEEPRPRRRPTAVGI